MPESKNSPEPPSEKIDFIGLWKRAGLLVWQNRFLLWFGILIALASPGGFNFSLPREKVGTSEDVARNFLTEHWKLALVLAAVLFATGIILFLISLVARAGFLKSVHVLTLGKKTNFREGWRAGKKYLVRLLKISLLLFFVILVLALILAVPVIFLLVANSWLAALFVGLLAIAIFIPLVFVLSFTAMFAEFYAVLSDLSVWSAVEAGYNLFLKNIANTLIFGLLMLAVSMIAAIITLPVAGIAFLLLAPAGFLFYFLNKIVFGIYLAFAVFLFALVMLFLSAVFTTFVTTAQVLFFKEIARIKTEEEAKATEKIIEKETAPASGPA